MDDGVQNTGTRKFLTVLPVATFLLASHGTAWERQVRRERREREQEGKSAHAGWSSLSHACTHMSPRPLPHPHHPQPLALNALALILCLVPKLPAMHRVRIFGINRW